MIQWDFAVALSLAVRRIPLAADHPLPDEGIVKTKTVRENNRLAILLQCLGGIAVQRMKRMKRHHELLHNPVDRRPDGEFSLNRTRCLHPSRPGRTSDGCWYWNW
jgi:hypothetical protein